MSTEKSVRSRLLMPMTSASTTSSARSSSLLVVDLDEHVEVEIERRAVQRSASVVVVERGDDQQDRVGAGRRGLVDLVGVDDEVLAQDRQRAGRARLAQVVERAAEVRALGEDRQRRGAAALVGARRCRSRSRRARISPAEGERRLCSAITRDARAQRAPRRTGGPRARSTAWRSSSRGGTRCRGGARTSSRVDVDDALEDAHAAACAGASSFADARRSASSARGRARRRRPPRAAASTPSAIESAPAAGVDRGAGVEQREVARGRARRRGSRA